MTPTVMVPKTTRTTRATTTSAARLHSRPTWNGCRCALWPFPRVVDLYRNFQYGDLANLTMLDLRTYRDKAPEFIQLRAIDDPNRTMLGSEQFEFLLRQWRNTSAKWRLVGNSVMFTPVLIPPLDPQATAAVTELLGTAPRRYPLTTRTNGMATPLSVAA